MIPVNKPLLTLCAADIMSAHVVTIPREMSLQGAARMLARAGVTGAPIVDATGRCIGVLSATDFMRWVEKDPQSGPGKGPMEVICSAWQIPVGAIEPSCRVEDFMTKNPVLVAPGTRITEVARIMMDAHIHRVIVADTVTHRPMGIVSSMDVLAAVARADPGFEEGIANESAMAGAIH
jgi:predicted transcriptional regulator